MIYGYARVSTAGQDLASQVAQLEAAGCEKVFKETASGAERDRRQLGAALRAAGPGDHLVVTRLDRLARSIRDLTVTLSDLDRRGVVFRSLGDPWADMTTPAGRLLITVLGGLGEFELSLIATRTREGRVRAKARGVKFGRKPSLSPEAVAHVASERAKPDGGSALTLRRLAKQYRVSVATIRRVAPAGHD